MEAEDGEWVEAASAEAEQWRILAIDDDLEVLDSYREIFSATPISAAERSLQALEKLGVRKHSAADGSTDYLLDCVSSGETGHRKVVEAQQQQRPYAVILLDMRMVPGWDGLETAEKIREVDRDVRIIIVTAYMDYDLTQIRHRIGVDFEFMNKPVDHEEIMQLVRLHAEKWSQQIAFQLYHNRLETLVEQRTVELQRANHKVEQAMDALAQEKSEIELILESMREGVVAVDRLGLIKHVNHSLERISGSTEQELAGQPVQQLFADAEPKQGLDPQTLSAVSLRLQQLVRGSADEIEGWIHSSLLAAMLVDEQGRIISCNGAMEGISGYGCNQLLGENISTLIPEPLRASHGEYLKRFFNNPKPQRMGGEQLLSLQQQSGAVIQVEIGLLPLLVDGVQRVLTLMHNPAEQQQWELFRITPFGKLFIAEEQLRADWLLKNRNGPSIPIYVTGAPLYDQQSEQSQFNGAVLVLHDMREILNAEKERRANQAKDEFLASTSHELRTPLTTILGNSEMLSNSELNSEQQQMLRSVDVAGRGLLALINDILDLSKIEAGKFQIDESDFDLHLLVHEIEHIFAGRIADAGLCFDIHYPAHLPHQLVGDSRRIGQIMINLLGNAIKFTEPGMISLSIQIDETEEKIRFTVEDTGMGMEPEVLDRLFQPYEQADHTISRRYGGTGLGLHISWTLAELMGGTINVESEMGAGSRFQLILPFRPSALPAAPLKKGDTQQLRWFKGSVLVAEDVPELQLLESRLLQSMGVAVTVVKNGKEALEVALEQEFDLLLMDMEMPELSGIEATSMLRQLGYRKPIVALTANVMKQHREQFEEAGCNGFLTKPIDRQELQEILAGYLSEQEQRPDTLLIDVTATNKTADVDDDLMKLFVERSRVKKQELMEALSQKNWGEIRSIAHMIKGVGTSFGHPQMTQLGREICDLIDREEMKEVAVRVEQLAREMMRVVCRNKDLL